MGVVSRRRVWVESMGVVVDIYVVYITYKIFVLNIFHYSLQFCTMKYKITKII